MALRLGIALLLFASLPVVCPATECLPLSEAQKHIGESRCVTGKVWNVKTGSRGVTFLDFCEDYRLCPFTVVVFGSDLKHVGDVRELKGKIVQIRGEIKDYDGRAEIVLKDFKQLGGEAARIPPLPKGYDVEKKGRYSAGKFSYPSSGRKPARKRQTARVETQDTVDPEAPEE